MTLPLLSAALTAAIALAAWHAGRLHERRVARRDRKQRRQHQALRRQLAKIKGLLEDRGGSHAVGFQFSPAEDDE